MNKLGVDNDGNYRVRYVIKNKFGHRVSEGKKSSIKHYSISHVWGFAGHPLFFSSLWNIVLIPTHFNYLMDKSDDAHPMVGRIKNTIKRICIELYDPYNSFIKQFQDREIGKSIKREFNIPSNGENIEQELNFVPQHGIEQKELSISKQEEERINTLLKKMGKKFFVDYFDDYEKGNDLNKVIPVGQYTYNSYHTKASTLRTIFKEDLELKALKLIVDSESSRLDGDTLDTAGELFKQYK